MPSESSENLQMLTAFFGLSVEQQKTALPVMQSERQYDFPDGDWRTTEAIEVLILAYAACLNSFSNTLLIQNSNEDESLENLIEELSIAIQSIELDECKVDIDRKHQSPKFEILRRLSRILSKRLQVKIPVSQNMLNSLISFYVHS
jgi:hypothetical protein